jgi:hypothetical protein
MLADLYLRTHLGNARSMTASFRSLVMRPSKCNRRSQIPAAETALADGTRSVPATFWHAPSSHARARRGPRLGPAFVLADHWIDDIMAVGIGCPSDPRYLVYIGTIGCASGHYHVELELPPLENADFPYTTAGSFDSVDYAALAAYRRGEQRS